MKAMTATLRARLERKFESTMEWAKQRADQGMTDCARANYYEAASIADRLTGLQRGPQYFTHWLTRRNVALQLANGM